MTKSRVVLALDSPMLRELLAKLLRQEGQIEVVEEVGDPVDALLGVDLCEVDAVIHSWPGTREMPGICSHLLGEYPHLLLIGIPPNAECLYTCRQEIAVTPLPKVGLRDVIDQIRQPAAPAGEARWNADESADPHSDPQRSESLSPGSRAPA